MFNTAGQGISLAEKRIRHALSMRIAVVLVVFFSASWALLQWALATEQAFMHEGVTRQFVQFEAMACAIVAACGLLHLAANGIAWLATVMRMRHHPAATRRHALS